MSNQRFTQLLPFSDTLNRSQLHTINMSGCGSLYAFMGILWNGDLITCCMDWTRARVMGNARESSLYDLWHGKRYSGMRALSDSGRLDEEPLCRSCGENRFSVDPEALRVLAAQQSADGDIALLEDIQARRQDNRELIQLGLMRG